MSRKAYQSTGDLNGQITRARQAPVVGKQALKDGFRRIGRMTLTPLHVSTKEEQVKPMRTFGSQPPAAKRIKYVPCLAPLERLEAWF